MADIRANAYAAGTGHTYPAYEQLTPSQKEYIHTTLNYLDMETTPQRRDNLAALMAKGTWKEHIRILREAVDSHGVQLSG